MRIRQYLPAFFVGFAPETAEFETLDELLAVPWVARCADGDLFHRFSVSGDHLMAEQNEGRAWFVVGTFRDEAPAGLPKWAAPEKGVRGPGGPNAWTRGRKDGADG